MKSRAACFIALLVLLTPPAGLLAQSTAGRIVGVVTDSTRAVLPGVTVTATNQETAQTVVTSTTAAGQYVLYPMTPGSYQVTFELPRFKSSRFRHVKVEVSRTVALDVQLELGEQSETTTVESRADTIAIDNPAFESMVTREQIDELPLNGRNFTQLIFLGPGSVDTSIDPDAGFGGIALNGNRAYSQEFLLDGTPNNNLFRGNSATPLSIDVIQEFKVSSAVAPAEKGQAGALVEVVTRGGTNRFHGSLFEYHRGNAGQARNPFNTLEDQPFSRHQFGGSLGGPIVIPGTYDGHDRTFFFINYEGDRRRERTTRVSTLPLDSFWRGDFSRLLDRGIQLRDPLASGRPPIPGNRLDLYRGGSLISPVAQKLRGFMGTPTFADRITNNALRFPEEFEHRHQATVRVDHRLAPRHSFSTRLTIDNEDSFGANVIGNDPTVGLTEPDESRNLSLSWTATIGSRSIIELRTGWSNYSDIVSYLPGNQPTVESLGLKGFEPSDALVPYLPRIVFSGLDAFTPIKYGRTVTFGEAALSLIDNVISLSEAFTHTRSTHVIKVGFQAYRTYLNVLQQTNARGQLTFNGSLTAARSTGYSFADFLVGLPASTQEVPIKPKVLLKRTELASFIQDDWAVSRRFTLSFGLRNEIFFNPVEERFRLSMFDLDSGAIVITTNDAGQLPTHEFLPRVVSRLTDENGAFRIPLRSDRDAGYARGTLFPVLWNNWGPRFGFGYRLNESGTAVLRGGYGIFYTRFPVQYLLQTIAVNPPFAGLFTYNQSISSSGSPSLTLESPFDPSRASSNIAPQGITRDFRLADNQEWNLTLERSLGWDTTATLAYIGNKGTHLFRSFNANARRPDPQTGQATTRYAQTYGTTAIRVRLSDADSIYNAMVLEFRRRGRSGLLFQGNWTWAKGIDDASNAAADALDVENLGRDRADSSFTRRHSIKMNAIYSLPFGRGRPLFAGLRGWRETAFGGWQLTGIWRYTTGRFMTPTFSGANALSSNRPDLVGARNPNLPRDERGPDRWFSFEAFAIPPEVDPQTGQARHGNSGRNILVGPGMNVLDLGVAKSFRLAEQARLSFRLEAFNALNHANWGNPVLQINDSSAGTISEIRLPMRQLQFALRFDF